MFLLPSVSASAAKTKKIYLITKAGDVKYTYSDNGLLKKEKNPHLVKTFYYNNDQRIRSVSYKSDGKNAGSYKITYSKNKIKKAVYYGTASERQNTNIYTWKKNKLTKKVFTNKAEKNYKGATTYTHNKKNYLIKLVFKDNADENYTCTYSYDAKGDLSKKITNREDDSTVEQLKITYKGGKPVNRTYTSTVDEEKKTTTFTCKAVKVPKQYIKTVEAQQRIIRNNQCSFAGASELGLYDSF